MCLGPASAGSGQTGVGESEGGLLHLTVVGRVLCIVYCRQPGTIAVGPAVIVRDCTIAASAERERRGWSIKDRLSCQLFHVSSTLVNSFTSL